METNSSNLLGLNYAEEAGTFTQLSWPIIDFHSHISGSRASQLLLEANNQFGIGHTFSMTPLDEVRVIREILGDKVSFISVPRFQSDDPLYEHGVGYVERIKEYHRFGARIAKFFCGPRLLDSIPGDFKSHPLRLDSVVRRPGIETALDLGMGIMVHIGDPDIWFKTRYKDSRKYGTKDDQYDILEWFLSTYRDVPVIAAHMAGTPENLKRLSDLLNRYPSLFIDTSAVKWQIRELSKHDAETRRSFFTKWQDRILFGSDIVTSDSHLAPIGEDEISVKATNQQEAYDLYASRLWALRTLFEKEYQGPSPIEDPDCLMIGKSSPPDLVSSPLPEEILRKLYRENALAVMKLIDPSAAL